MRKTLRYNWSAHRERIAQRHSVHRIFRWENSDFVRFNHGRVRQAGSVEQGSDVDPTHFRSSPYRGQLFYIR